VRGICSAAGPVGSSGEEEVEVKVKIEVKVKREY